MLLALTLFACGNDKDVIQLDWELGETFHLAAAYRHVNVKASTANVSLTGDSPAPDFTESWSDTVLWTYQVVEQGLDPSEGDTLQRFVGDSKGTLTVLRASIDPTLNDDEEVLEADPVVYLVFREDRDRLAGLVTFVNVDGARQEIAYSLASTDTSYNALSQSQLTMAPAFLAPFGARWSDVQLTLENGSLLETVAGDGYTDAIFEDELGGGLVATRYEDGQPWPTWTVTDNLEARLVSESEVARLREARPWALPTPPEDFDYKAALATSIDLDDAVTLDSETMDGGWEANVYEGYEPWAGSWWRQSEGALVFGYDDRATLSDRIKGEIDPIKTEMDELSAALRELEQGTSEYDEKAARYQELQSELVEALVGFYDGVQSDLDGGALRIEGGSLVHDEGWSYDLDELSPFDKMALYEHFSGNLEGNNAWYLPAWELLNHYSPAGGSWWGHCNGWAAAAILADEPRDDVDTSIDGTGVTFTHADLKGLYTESHYSTYSHFYGARYNGEDDDISDLSPKAFHQIVSFYVREQGVPLVFDTTASEAVWNYPIRGLSVSVTETGGQTGPSGLVNVNTVDVDRLVEVGFWVGQAHKIVDHRLEYGPFQSVDELEDIRGVGRSKLNELRDLLTVSSSLRTFDVVADVYFVTDGVAETWLDGDVPEGFTNTYAYELVTDDKGVVTGGTWANVEEHPDFAWVPYTNPVTWGQGSSENPFLSYGSLLEIVDLSRE